VTRVTQPHEIRCYSTQLYCNILAAEQLIIALCKRRHNNIQIITLEAVHTK